MVSIGLTLPVPVYAKHVPTVKVRPEFMKGAWPDWVYFDISNVGDPIVGVKITHLEIFEPIEFSGPDGFIVDYKPAERLVEWLSTDPYKYNIPNGFTGVFGIKFGSGPTSECSYAFIVSTSDTSGEGFVFGNVTIKIDKTPPYVKIVDPRDCSTIEAQFDPISERYFMEVYVESYDVGVHPSGIDHVELYVDGNLVDKEMAFINSQTHLYYSKFYFSEKAKDLLQREYIIKAVAYDKSYPDGNSASATIRISVTSKPFITIDPTSGYVGTTVTVKGYGFSKNSPIWIVFRDVHDGRTVFHSVASENNGTHLIQWKPHLDSSIVKTLKSDADGRFTTTFEVPDAYGGYHAIYAGEVSQISYTDGRYNFQQETYCKLFKVLPKIWTDQAEGQPEELITLYGSGQPLPVYYWAAINPKTGDLYSIEWDWYFKLDFGEYDWVDEATHRLGQHGETNNWYAGEYYPVSFRYPLDDCSLVYSGRICRKESFLYLPAFSTLEVPVLSPGTYTIKVYQFGCTHEQWDGSEKWTNGDNFFFVAETTFKIIAKFSQSATLTQIANDVASIQDGLKTLVISLGELGANVQSIKDGVVTLNTNYGILKSNLDAINAKIISIEETMVTLETDIGTIKTDVNAINARVVGIDGKVVTIETDVGEIKGIIVGIDGKVLTVDTNKGIIQATMSNELHTLYQNLQELRMMINTILTIVIVGLAVSGFSIVTYAKVRKKSHTAS
jgi:hypothetical protein